MTPNAASSPPPVPPVTPRDARDRLIVALDLPSVDAARAAVEGLGDSVVFYKIGYRLAYAGGLGLVRELADAGKRVFLDLKLHDIGNTVAEGVASLGALGATFLTVHAYPQTMRAAASVPNAPAILAVTVLTSYDDADAADAGYAEPVAALVRRRSAQAREAGCAGVVCAAHEAAAVREAAGPGLSVVCPGVRPAGAASGDQKRVMTPSQAIRAGADFLVVGRPILSAADPAGAARAVVDEIAAAL